MTRNILLKAEIFTMMKDKGIHSMKTILMMGFNTDIFHCFFTIREGKHFPGNFP